MSDSFYLSCRWLFVIILGLRGSTLLHNRDHGVFPSHPKFRRCLVWHAGLVFFVMWMIFVMFWASEEVLSCTKEIMVTWCRCPNPFRSLCMIFLYVKSFFTLSQGTWLDLGLDQLTWGLIARAYFVIPTTFGMTFHVTQGMEDDTLFSLSLICNFEAMMGLDKYAFQLSHSFGELGEGRFWHVCDWDIFILNTPLPLS